jgi:hypothetical protein
MRGSGGHLALKWQNYTQTESGTWLQEGQQAAMHPKSNITYTLSV